MQTTTLKIITQPKLNRIKVLVIEDDEQTAELVRIFLSMNGYRIQIETSSTDIAGLLEVSNPDLLIIDYLLPFMNGGELCAIVKKDMNWKHLPVIIYSAYPKVINSLGIYQCNAFLAKPFELDDLLNLVERSLFKQPSLSKKFAS